MAIQVRLDLTPSEFDLTRRALDSYIAAQTEIGKAQPDGSLSAPGRSEFERARREAQGEATQAARLREKLNV